MADWYNKKDFMNYSKLVGLSVLNYHIPLNISYIRTRGLNKDEQS